MNNTKISKNHNDKLISLAVRSIFEAVYYNVPEYCKDNYLITYNSIGFARIDFINRNLFSNMKEEGIIIHPTTRYSWTVLIIIDTKNRSTYCIMSESSLKRLNPIERKAPHYLQTIAGVLNKDVKDGQLQLFNSEQYSTSNFTSEEIMDDFNNIFSGLISPDSGYRHFVISYKAIKRELTNLQLLLVDPQLNIIEADSLAEYIPTDYALLTEEVFDSPNNSSSEEVPDVKPLISLKQGPALDLKKIIEDNKA